MRSTSLTALAHQQLGVAREAPAGRSAVTVYGGREHDLRQTLIALQAGTVLGEHESPGEATLHVLEGRVTLRSAGDEAEVGAGELVVLPAERHDVAAIDDSVMLLTVATRGSEVPAEEAVR